ncbi:hypothetical protein QUB68_18175 [Microcoleus sp. A006_D1]
MTGQILHPNGGSVVNGEKERTCIPDYELNVCSQEFTPHIEHW